MQFVLHDQVRRQQPLGQLLGLRWWDSAIHGAEEATTIARMDAAEEGGGLAPPRQHGELVHRRDDEGRQLAIDLLIDEQDRQTLAILRRGEVTAKIRAADQDLLRARLVGLELQAVLAQRPSAPRAGRKWKRRLRHRRIAVSILRDSLGDILERVRRRGLPDPQAQRETNLSKPSVRLANQLQRTDQGRRAAKLVERQQPKRVAQEHRDTETAIRPPLATQPSQNQVERDHAEVCLGLPAARREED